MPCSCIVDKPTYPQNEEWGPLLWWILHTLAEKAGRQTNPISQGDEQRAWPLFLKELPTALPCPFCREHLQGYVAAHPFALPQDPYEWKTYVPTYLYELHEDVNKRLGKPSFPKETLSQTYKDTGQFKDVLTRLQGYADRAVKMGGLSLFHWRAWVKQLNLLRAAIL